MARSAIIRSSLCTAMFASSAASRPRDKSGAWARPAPAPAPPAARHRLGHGVRHADPEAGHPAAQSGL
jgi:hypothetical protein